MSRDSEKIDAGGGARPTKAGAPGRTEAEAASGGRTGAEAGAAKLTKAELSEQLGDEFRINQNRSQVFDDIAAEYLGMNPTDMRCLDIVQRLGGATAGRLALESGLTSGGVTAVVDRLERIGYARRVHDPDDRRRVLIEVTPEFFERAWEVWEPMADAWKRQSRRLSREQLEFLLRFLREADEILDEHIERLRALRDGSE